MGSFLTRGLVMMFGYTYPAYQCFKTVDKNKPDIEQLRFWCRYWIIVSLLTVFERFGDVLLSWLPMYGETKLAFFVYLWHPKTMGATYIYETFLSPYVASHETEIDRNLLELRVRAGDMAVLYWQRAASYGQATFFEVVQYVASKSSNLRPPQMQWQQQQMNTSYFRPFQGATADRQPVEEPQQMQQPPLRKTGAAKSQRQGPQQVQKPPTRQSDSAMHQPQEPQQLQQPLPDQASSRVAIQAALPPSSSLPLTEWPPSQPHPPSEPEDETQSEATASGQSISGTQELHNMAEGSLSDTDDARRAAETALPESYGDESTSITEDLVMEDTIRTTRARLRRTRTGKQIDV